MSKIKTINENIASIEQEMRALTSAAEKREELSMTADETKKFEELRAKRDELRSTLAALEEVERLDMQQAQQRQAAAPAEDAAVALEKRAFCNFVRGESLSPEERTALTMENGKAVVPVHVQNDIMLGLQGASNILSHIDLIVSDSAGTLTFPVATAPMTLEKIAIGTASTEGEVEFIGIELSAYDYRTKPIPVSETLLAASDADVYQAIVDLFVDHIGFALSKKVIVDGTDNKDFGAILSTATVVAGAEPDTITLDDIVDLMSAVKAPFDDITRAKFLVSSSTKKALLKIRDDHGFPIYARGVAEGAPATIFGYPVIVDDNMPNIGANKLAMAFGDFKTYKARIVKGVRVKMYDESKYADQGCIGLQGFVTGDGRPVRKAGSVEPIAVLKCSAS